MPPRMHPSRKLIASYATGDLPLGPALTIGVHLDGCGTCRLAVGDLEETQGRLLTSLPGTPLRPDALEHALAQIEDDPETLDPTVTTPRADGIQLPDTVQRIGLSPAVHLDRETWIAHLAAPRIGGWRTYIFCGPADVALPRHGHLGDELIAVLEGGFFDGRDFTAGDFAENKTGYVHDMQVSSQGRMVALISSEGPIDWSAADRNLGALLDI
jgi:putative transcriptional regulator